MNSQIKELVEKANNLSIRYANENNINCVDAFNIVYAELIAKECAEIGFDSVNAGHDIDILKNYVRNNILKNFGVEE